MIQLQLKRHNCGRWESFRGLVDILKMCFLCGVLVGDVRFGRYKPMKEPNFLIIVQGQLDETQNIMEVLFR